MEKYVFTCDICKTENIPMKYAILEFDETGEHYLRTVCSRCNSLRGTCGRCAYGDDCAFFQEEDGLPQMVMKTIQQGIMIVQQQVPNPERIEKYCKVCNCWDDEYGCFKQGNRHSIPTCRNYIERE